MTAIRHLKILAKLAGAHPFFSAPHRVMFAAGTVQAMLVMAWFAIDLGGRYARLYPPPAWRVPPGWFHANLMLFGVFTFFIFGFLMTALPKWVGRGPLSPPQYLAPFIGLAAGWMLVYAGLAWPSAALAGALLGASGWIWGWVVLVRIARSPAPGFEVAAPLHLPAVLVALGFGCVGSLLMAAGTVLVRPEWVRNAIDLGIWFYLAPVFFTVTHRMLPVFTAAIVRGYRPLRSIPLFAAIYAALFAHGAAELARLPDWTFLSDGIAAGLVTFWFLSGKPRRAFAAPLLATHHLAVLWLAAALALFALRAACRLAGFDAWTGVAPLHALSIGYFATMLVGMMTRVTLGHSGRPIAADRLALPLFWLLQAVLVLRLAGEWLPWPDAAGIALWIAGMLWLLAFGSWALRYLAVLLRPRPDGQPG
jgi:uncharacterized protein involved in response to NO